MESKKPIFIFGMGRSGTTIFHRMLTEHPNVAWLSGLCRKYPNKPKLNRMLMKAIDYPVFGYYLRKRLKPEEAYEFWEYYCKGFSTPCRDIFSEDVTSKAKDNIQSVLSEMLTKKRDRLLVKITGWPRVGYLNEIFNDAIFIHVVRDGRAVVNSRVNVDFWTGWGGPLNWNRGELDLCHKEEWEKYNRSVIVLVAIEWKIVMDALENAKKFIKKSNLIEIKYEKLCSEPLTVVKDCIEFSDLKWSKNYETNIKKYQLKNENYKWQKELTDKQQKILTEVLSVYLEKYGYL